MTIELTDIRRLFLVITLLLTVALGVVVFLTQKEADALNARRVNVVAYTLKEKEAAGVKKEYAESGYTIEVQKDKFKFQVPDGFQVILPLEDPVMARSVRASLLQKSYIKKLGLDTVDEGKSLKVHRKFPKRQAAQNCANLIKKKDNYAFEVRENLKSVPKMGFRCQISDIPIGEAQGVMDYLKEHKFSDITAEMVQVEV